MKKMIIFLAIGGLMAGCSTYESGTSDTNGQDGYPASNPVGAPGSTVEESVEGGVTNQVEW